MAVKPPNMTDQSVIREERSYFTPRADGSSNQVQTMVLISFDGALDRQTGTAIYAGVRNLLDLGIRSIFLDLSDVVRVDATGVFHLVEILNYADSLGGRVAILESSVALADYFQNS